jgi:heterodisulfide reductase subunit A2
MTEPDFLPNGTDVTDTTPAPAGVAGDAPAATPRIGVYVCQCGGNIGDVVDVGRVVDRAAQLPHVVVVRSNTFMCSDPGQLLMEQDIREERLDRVVVAACSPKLHEQTFRGVLSRAGLNLYLYEHANIREQVSWATDDIEEATTKASTLVAAAVAKAAHLAPLEAIRVEAHASAVVVGGGVAGLKAARDLSLGGISVTLVERSAALGGNVALLDRLFPNEEAAGDIVSRLVREVVSDLRITTYTQAEVEQVGGYVGNFTVVVRQQANGVTFRGDPLRSVEVIGRYQPFEGFVFETDIHGPAVAGSDVSAGTADGDGSAVAEFEVGAVVVATGFEHYVPAKGEYGYLRLPQVITLPDFIRWLAGVDEGGGLPERDGRPIGGVAFIHCVGSRQVEGVNKPQADGKINEYCSRVCCTATLQAIGDLQQKRSAVATYDFYQDIRAYGRGHEEYYERAAKGGTVFVRFDGQAPPVVAKAGSGESHPVLVSCPDGLTWGEEVEAAVDLVVLAVGMVPADVSAVVEGLKLPRGADRFLSEVHPKLRPVEMSVNGVLLAGASQGPKDVTETTASASAAAVKAIELLSSGHVDLDPFVAHVEAGRCEGHGGCVAECPYPGAVELHEYADGRRRAVVNPALCSGCGACVAVCPVRAIDLAGWTLEQYESMVDAILRGDEVGAR